MLVLTVSSNRSVLCEMITYAIYSQQLQAFRNSGSPSYWPRAAVSTILVGRRLEPIGRFLRRIGSGLCIIAVSEIAGPGSGSWFAAGSKSGLYVDERGEVARRGQKKEKPSKTTAKIAVKTDDGDDAVPLLHNQSAAYPLVYICSLIGGLLLPVIELILAQNMLVSGQTTNMSVKNSMFERMNFAAKNKALGGLGVTSAVLLLLAAVAAMLVSMSESTVAATYRTMKGVHSNHLWRFSSAAALFVVIRVWGLVEPALAVGAKRGLEVSWLYIIDAVLDRIGTALFFLLVWVVDSKGRAIVRTRCKCLYG